MFNTSTPMFVLGQNVVNISDGYWTFTDIQREFKDKGIKLIGNFHNGTCTLKSTGKDIKLGKLGMMLGFGDAKYISKDTWYYFDEVSINHGLKYVKISADTVDSDSNFDKKGHRSNIITTVPV